MEQNIEEKGKKIRLVLTDVDGVLTDGGVYYGVDGEVLKRFNIRDGMGVVRLREAGIETGIVTGEISPSVSRRAEKLTIGRVVLGCSDKKGALREILSEGHITADEIAYIGDDVNDLEIMREVGLTATPSDGLPQVRAIADYICTLPGGHGAFREFAEFVLGCRRPIG